MGSKGRGKGREGSEEQRVVKLSSGTAVDGWCL